MAHVISADEVKKSLKLKYGHAIYPDGARKVKFGHVIDEDVNGAKLARKFYSAGAFGGYTGEFTVSQITKDGVLYNLYTLTGSGTLTLNDSAEYWMCGGGGNGRTAHTSNQTGGPGGGGGNISSGEISAGEYVVTIGGAVGTTTLGELTAAYGSSGGASGGGAGASGGGASGGTNAGKGKKVSTIPFSDSTNFKPHCAGGGGGATGVASDVIQAGGAGGSDGSDGGSYTNQSSKDKALGGAGGNYGGGKGGNVGGSGGVTKGSAATFYGSGGGGGAYNLAEATGIVISLAGGSGYQGVCYILIPA